jgi:hypothetical protein
VDLAWPTAPDGTLLAFALQIDLAEVPPQVAGLPPHGLLSLFVTAHQGQPTVAFVVTPPELATTPRDEPDGVPHGFLSDAQPSHLEIVARPDTPRWATSDYAEITQDMDEEEEAGYEQLGWSLAPPGRVVVGRLLGHAAGIGVDPREDAAAVRDLGAPLYDWAARARLTPSQVRRWKHLLTLDSARSLGLTIHDAGYLQVLVRDDSLTTLDLGGVWADIQSS